MNDSMRHAISGKSEAFGKHDPPAPTFTDSFGLGVSLVVNVGVDGAAGQA